MRTHALSLFCLAAILLSGLTRPAIAQDDACRFLTTFYKQYMGDPHEIMPYEQQDSLLRHGCTPAPFSATLRLQRKPTRDEWVNARNFCSILPVKDKTS